MTSNVICLVVGSYGDKIKDKKLNLNWPDICFWRYSQYIRWGVPAYGLYRYVRPQKGMVKNRKLQFFISVKCDDKEKVYYMSLQTKVTKGFLVSFQLLCFYGDLREKSY